MFQVERLKVVNETLKTIDTEICSGRIDYDTDELIAKIIECINIAHCVDDNLALKLKKEAQDNEDS